MFLVRVGHCSQPVGDDDQGLAPGQVGDGPLDYRLVLGVNTCGGFIQDHDGGVLQNGPGNGDPLLLPAGQVPAATAADRVVPMIQRPDELVAPSGFCYPLHFLVAGIQTAHADVFPNRAVKEVVVLGHVGDLPVQLLQGNVFQIGPAQGDTAAGHVPEPGDQFGDGALAGAGGTHQGGDGARRDVQGDVMEHLTVLRLVGERDVVQMDSHTAEGSLPLRPLEFRGIQDGGDLPHIGAHHRQFIHKGHGGDQRPCETQGQHYNSEEGGGGQAATGPQQQSHRQHRQQHRGDHRLHDGHELLVFRHPVHIVLGVLRYRIGVSLIGTGGTG